MKDEKRLEVIQRVYRSELTVVKAARVMDSASGSVTGQGPGEKGWSRR